MYVLIECIIYFIIRLEECIWQPVLICYLKIVVFTYYCLVIFYRILC